MKRIKIIYDGTTGDRDLSAVMQEIAEAMSSAVPHFLEVTFDDDAFRGQRA